MRLNHHFDVFVLFERFDLGSFDCPKISEDSSFLFLLHTAVVCIFLNRRLLRESKMMAFIGTALILLSFSTLASKTLL